MGCPHLPAARVHWVGVTSFLTGEAKAKTVTGRRCYPGDGGGCGRLWGTTADICLLTAFERTRYWKPGIDEVLERLPGKVRVVREGHGEGGGDGDTGKPRAWAEGTQTVR